MKLGFGTGVALVTPFKEDQSIDLMALKRLVNHLIDGGIEYLVVLGTTGETATMSFEEQVQVLTEVKRVNAGRLPIVLGIGGNDTQAMMKRFNAFDMEGVDAILCASPYYNKPSQEGIYQHYKTLAAATPRPIFLYNVPGRTASNMSAETTLRLARDFDKIIGIKEASADLDQVMEILRDKPEDFFVTSGEDALAYPMSLMGGSGVISVVGNAYPKEFSTMIRSALDQKIEPGKSIHFKLLEFTKLCFAEGNPGGIKAALKFREICGDTMRQPLWPVSDQLRQQIGSVMNSLEAQLD